MVTEFIYVYQEGLFKPLFLFPTSLREERSNPPHYSIPQLRNCGIYLITSPLMGEDKVRVILNLSNCAYTDLLRLSSPVLPVKLQQRNIQNQGKDGRNSHHPDVFLDADTQPLADAQDDKGQHHPHHHTPPGQKNILLYHSETIIDYDLKRDKFSRWSQTLPA